MLESTVPLEDIVPLETQLLGEDTNKEEKILLLKESDKYNDIEVTIGVDNLYRYIEENTKLLDISKKITLLSVQEIRRILE